jgi:hypothetical protein
MVNTKENKMAIANSTYQNINSDLNDALVSMNSHGICLDEHCGGTPEDVSEAMGNVIMAVERLRAAMQKHCDIPLAEAVF